MHYDHTQPYAIKRCKHGLLAYSLNDTLIGRSLDSYGEWCEYEIDLLRGFLNPDDVAIDVGANIGTHMLAFSRIVGQYGRVYALEAQPRLYNMLRANAALNGLMNVTPWHVAVGATEGALSIADLPPDDTVFNYGALPLMTPTLSRTSVRQTTIDALGLEPDLIKIDVEGMEADVIRGARETIKRHSPVLYLENNGPDSSKIAAALDEIGYRAWWSIAPYFNPNNHFGNQQNIWPSNLVPSANLIAIHPERGNYRGVGSFADLPPFTGAADNWTLHEIPSPMLTLS